MKNKIKNLYLKISVIFVTFLMLFSTACALSPYNFPDHHIPPNQWEEFLRSVDWAQVLRDADIDISGFITEDMIRDILSGMDLMEFLSPNDIAMLMDAILATIATDPEFAAILVRMLIENPDFREFLIELILEYGGGGGIGLPPEDILRVWLRIRLLEDPFIRELYEAGILTSEAIDAMVEAMLRSILDSGGLG
ncbi:MAG: hypothetical protein FWE13_00970 [Firmicutes bacterium]|nr:hypothetical protein [Bacillota bacterium]